MKQFMKFHFCQEAADLFIIKSEEDGGGCIRINIKILG